MTDLTTVGTRRKRITCEKLGTMCMPFKEYFELIYEQLFDTDERERKEADRIIRTEVKIAQLYMKNGEKTILPKKYFDYVISEDLEKDLQAEYKFAFSKK